jgi:hypothetical protein
MVVAGLCVLAVAAGRVVCRRNRRGSESETADGADHADDCHRGEVLLLEDSHRVSLSEVGTQAGCEDRQLHLARSAVGVPIRR